MVLLLVKHAYKAAKITIYTAQIKPNVGLLALKVKRERLAYQVQLGFQISLREISLPIVRDKSPHCLGNFINKCLKVENLRFLNIAHFCFCKVSFIRSLLLLSFFTTLAQILLLLAIVNPDEKLFTEFDQFKIQCRNFLI